MKPCIEIPFLFHTQLYSFVLLKYVHYMAPCQYHYYICPLWGGLVLLLLYKGVPGIGSWEGPTGLRRPMATTEADLAQFLLHVSKTLFYSVLHCIVFFDDSDANTQWSEMIRLLFLTIGNTYHLLSSRTSPYMFYFSHMEFVFP